MVCSFRFPSPFELTVAEVVRSIPKGSTLSYGEVALRANRPGAARAVVRALHSIGNIPWWRVIRSDSTLAPEVANEQAKQLRAEGVTVVGRRVVRRKRGTKKSRPRVSAR